MFKKSHLVGSLIVCFTLLFGWMAPAVQSQSSIAKVIITDVVAETRPGEHPLVTVYVSVLDSEGQHVPGLEADDFLVQEFTNPVSGVSVSSERQGVAVDLLVDISGSMDGRGMSGRKLQDVQEAVGQFIASLQGEDLAGIFTFCKEVEQIQPLTTAHESAGSESAITIPTDPALQFTCLFDAMWDAIEDLTSGEEELGSEFIRMKKAIFVFSDGADSGLGTCRHELIDVKRWLMTRDPKGTISVYAVGVGSEETGNFGDLMNLADITEGEFIHYFGRTEQEQEEIRGKLNGAFDSFLTQGEQYVIRYGTETSEEQVTLRVQVGGRADEAEVEIPSVSPIVRLSGVNNDQAMSGIVELKPELVLEQSPIREMAYFVNGVKMVTVASPFTWEWDTSTLLDNPKCGPVEVDAQGNGLIKNVVVRVEAIDQKGLVGTDQVSGLEVQILPPQVEILVDNTHIERTGGWRTELEDTVPQELPVEIKVTWPNQHRNIERVEYFLDGQQSDTATRLEPRELDISTLGSIGQDTQHTLQVQVIDELNLVAEAEIPLSVSMDVQTLGDILIKLLGSNVMGLVAMVIALITLVLFLRSPKKAIEAVGGGIRKVTEFLGIATKGTRLVLIEDGKDSSPYAVYDVTNLGRDESKADITFDHPRVSRLHATLVKEDEDFVLYDQGSKNGTWVNDQRLPFKGHRVLENGDVIDLGRGGVILRFEMEGEAKKEEEGQGQEG